MRINRISVYPSFFDERGMVTYAILSESECTVTYLESINDEPKQRKNNTQRQKRGDTFTSIIIMLGDLADRYHSQNSVLIEIYSETIDE